MSAFLPSPPLDQFRPTLLPPALSPFNPESQTILGCKLIISLHPEASVQLLRVLTGPYMAWSCLHVPLLPQKRSVPASPSSPNELEGYKKQTHKHSSRPRSKCPSPDGQAFKGGPSLLCVPIALSSHPLESPWHPGKTKSSFTICSPSDPTASLRQMGDPVQLGSFESCPFP